MKSSRSKFTLAERRNVLRVLSAGASLTLPGWVLGSNSIWMPDDLPLTPQQIEGPFYPETTIEKQLYNDTDLSRKLKNHELAKGQLAVIEGIVKDRKGHPLKHASVEVWQACASGRYQHSRDNDNVNLLDNNFQFWGRAVTDEDGKYSFTTIIPGKYPGRTARHIHYRVEAEGFKRCTTQCYFSDFGEDNLRDGVYSSLKREERNLVTIEFDKPTETKDGNQSATEKGTTVETVTQPTWKGQFDIVMAAGYMAVLN